MVAMGIEWVLMGHSERRGEFGLPTPAESPALLATKLAHALSAGLKVVFCIGEPLAVREQGIGAVVAELVRQLEDIKPHLKDPSKVQWRISRDIFDSRARISRPQRCLRLTCSLLSLNAIKGGACIRAGVGHRHGRHGVAGAGGQRDRVLVEATG